MARNGMMTLFKTIVIILPVVLLAVFQLSFAGDKTTITADEVDSVFKALSKGKWSTVESLAQNAIQRRSPAQENLAGRLRYIYLHAVLKQVEARSLSYGDVTRKLGAAKGKLIIQPWHPIDHDDSPCFNQICGPSDKPNHLYTAQTNHDGSQIYSFEYFTIGYPLDISSYDGQNGRLGGILKRIDINRNLERALKEGSSVTWFVRLHVEKAFIHFER